MSDFIEVYTDGACLNNPGPGGWAFLIIRDGLHYEKGGHKENTTNNIMEMTAAVKALEELIEEKKPVKIFTDSNYLKKGITMWIHQWKFNDWKRAKGQEVKNKDLWITLDALNRPEIQWEWVKGHADNPYNQRVDEIANCFAREKDCKLLWGEKPAESEKPEQVKKAGKVYLSLVNDKLGKHSSWDLCRARVHGVSRAKFKLCKSRQEQLDTLEKWRIPPGELDKIEIDEITVIKTPAKDDKKLLIYICLPFIKEFSDTLRKKGFVQIQQNDGDYLLLEKDETFIKIRDDGAFIFSGRLDDDVLDLIFSIQSADDRYLKKYMKTFPIKFPRNFADWKQLHFQEFLRPFLKGMVGTWNFINLDNQLKITDKKTNLNFEIRQDEEYSWKSYPPGDITKRVVSTAKKSAVFGDRVSCTISGYTDTGFSIAVLPFSKNTLNLSLSRNWQALGRDYDKLEGREKHRIKKQLKSFLENYYYHSFGRIEPFEVKEKAIPRLFIKTSRWLAKCLKKWTDSLPGWSSGFKVDLIVDESEMSNSVKEFFDKLDFKRVCFRPAANEIESSCHDFCQFMSDRIHQANMDAIRKEKAKQELKEQREEEKKKSRAKKGRGNRKQY